MPTSAKQCVLFYVFLIHGTDQTAGQNGESHMHIHKHVETSIVHTYVGICMDYA
jgi:hypothetical protein